MLSLIYAKGKVDDVDRNQTGSALEFGDYHAGTAIQAYEERSAPTYVQAQTWKSPRVITSHVLEEFLPKQLKEGKGKVANTFFRPSKKIKNNNNKYVSRPRLPPFLKFFKVFFFIIF